MPDLSIIIVNWNTRDLLAKCIDSINENIPEFDTEIIVVDNASTDDSQQMLRQKYPQVQLIANTENVGFAKANNQAMEVAKGHYFLLWNSDAFTTPGAIQALRQLADSQPQAGIIGAQLLNEDGSFQASYTPFPNLCQEFLILSGLGRMFYGYWYPSRSANEEKEAQIVDYVEGACMWVRREAFEDAGGLDEGYFMYAEEVDWCYTMHQKGWQVWYQPAARVIHLGGGSSYSRKPQREADLYRSRVRFFRKHYGHRTAWFLKLQIYFFSAIKIIVHKLLRLVSRGHYGRPVVSWKNLVMELEKI